ncbi:gephyrin-like molybdotransferase Glp [Chloroflexota bacterium]
MISVEQALEKILGYVDVLEAEESPILDTLGLVLAEDVVSTMDVPPLDNSAMDGYAVIAEDIRGAGEQSPRYLKVIGTVPAGSISKQAVIPGTAVRIMTGAPVPSGADTVVQFENTDETQREPNSSEIGILAEAEVGLNIRRAGEDITKGSVTLRQGTVLQSAEIGVLASLGRTSVRVIRRPVVAILSTGDEVVDISQPLPPGKIYNSNTYSLAALVKRYGGVPRLLGIALDNEDSLITKLHEGLDSDMLITTGGVSVGDYDVVKDVLAKEGEIGFWRVRMKPGKPLAFGSIKGVPHLGLPGNPVSTMVTFELFARPAILKMQGKQNWTKPVIEATIEGSVKNTDGRRIYARAMVGKRDGQYFARLTGPQGSGILTSMTSANGLVIVPEERAGVEAGEMVQVMMLNWDNAF